MTLAIFVPGHGSHCCQDLSPSRRLCFFVSIALVAAGASFWATGVSKKENFFAMALGGGPGVEGAGVWAVLVVGLKVGLVITLALGVTMALGLDLPLLKRKTRATRGSNCAASASFSVSLCFVGAAGVKATISFASDDVSITKGVRASGSGVGTALVMGVAVAAGLTPLKSRPHASMGVALDGDAGGDAAGSLNAASFSFCGTVSISAFSVAAVVCVFFSWTDNGLLKTTSLCRLVAN